MKTDLSQGPFAIAMAAAGLLLLAGCERNTSAAAAAPGSAPAPEAAAAEANAPAQSWPNWRGPRANGSVETGNPPTRWSAENILWKVEMPGKGTSTPIVWNNTIYVTAPDGGDDVVLAYDFSGKPAWRKAIGPASPPKHATLGSSCNASPVTDGKGLFVYFRSGNLAALELDGSIRWQVNIAERFGPERLFWDQGGSPVLTDRDVVIARMHEGESWIAGFDKQTGEMRWQQPRNFKTPRENDNGYTTPVPFQHNGKPALLVWGADHLTAHDAADGSLLWSCGGFNPSGQAFWPAISMPAIVNDIVVVPVGRDDRGQARVHGIRLGGSGDVTATHRAWQRDDVGVFVPSLTEYKGSVYLLRHRGEIIRMNPATGETIWNESLPRHRGSYYSSPVIANGILYAAREDGAVFVVSIENGFELLSENEMGERLVASPVPINDRLLLRGDHHLFCIGPARTL